MIWLLNLLGWVLGKLFGKPERPSQEAVQAAKAASAATALNTQEADNVAVLKASAASAAVVRSVVSDDRLRQYEARDPNNRDND